MRPELLRRGDNISVIIQRVDAGELIRRARTWARLSQRGLAAHAGMPQPAVSRIERGHVSPRIDTVDQLLRACGVALELVPRPGRDVDRTLILERLRLTPAERARLIAREWNATGRFRIRTDRR
jgi:transcriptional regulator with XRE-family HTH domain